jgi:hypothetical protein
MPKELTPGSTDIVPLTNLERIANPLEAITELSSIDELDEAVSHARGVLAKMKATLKDCQDEYEMQMLEIIKVRGAFQLGEMKYCAGVKKSDKQAKPKDILMALSKAVGKDFEKITNCLASSCFKPGESKKVLGKDTKLFWSEESDTLKTSVLKTINTKFLT